MGVAATLLSARPFSRPLDLSTFVTVGNATQPFDRLLRAVADVSGDLPHPIVVQRGRSTVSHEDWKYVDFFPMDEFEKLIDHSSLLIMHAGAGSVINAVRAGRLPIVMPRRAAYGEHVDDHQLEFAIALESTNYVLIARDSGELRSAVPNALACRDRRASASIELIKHIGQMLARLEGSR
jgi:UDP-N-acetylglucosamine transferase subunit ALG13